MCVGFLDDDASDLVFGTESPAVYVSHDFTRNNSASSSVTVNAPAGTESGDVLIFFWFGAGGGPAQITARPSGFTNLHAGSVSLDGSPAYQDCDVKIATAAEPGSYTWTLNGGAEEGLAVLLCYRPAHATQLDAIAGAAMGTNSASHTAPNVTTIQDQATVISAYMINASGGGGVNIATPPADMVNRENIDGSPVGRSDLRLAIYEDHKSKAGLYSGKALTTNANAHGYGITAAIRALGS